MKRNVLFKSRRKEVAEKIAAVQQDIPQAAEK